MCIKGCSKVTSLTELRMGLNWVVLVVILSLTIEGGSSITLEEIMEEIELLRYENKMLRSAVEKNITELSAQNQQQDIRIEYVAESASSERDIIMIHVRDNSLVIAQTQDELMRTQDVLIPGVGAILPWIPSKKYIQLFMGKAPS